jgi:hypothetical protein
LSQFHPWGLTKSMKNLIDQEAANKGVYNFRDARIVDQSGVHASFEMSSDTGNLFTSIEARDSLKSFLKAQSDPDGLTINWLSQSEGVPHKEVRSLLGVKQTREMQTLMGTSSNEMIVQAHCRQEDLDYVTSQLRRFSK